MTNFNKNNDYTILNYTIPTNLINYYYPIIKVIYKMTVLPSGDMHALLGMVKSQSHNNLPINSAGKETNIKELEEELLSEKLRSASLQEKCVSLTNSVWTLEHTILNTTHGTEMHTMSEKELRAALKTAQAEKEQLVILVGKYQQLVKAYQSQPITRRLTSNETEGFFSSEESTTKYTALKDEDWRRRPSGSSSYLYAGVEGPPDPPPSLRDSCIGTKLPPDTISLDTLLSTPSILPALTQLLRGTWLYKYPRRQYAKLIAQQTIPTGQLSYRYFWLHPMTAALIWATTPGGEGKQVSILDYFTERRGVGGECATVVVILTGGESLAVVPATNEDLATWLDGLSSLMKLKRNKAWPENLAVCAIRNPM
jgi:hypothetical protein